MTSPLRTAIIVSLALGIGCTNDAEDSSQQTDGVSPEDWAQNYH